MNTTEELIMQLLMLVVTGAIAIVGNYLKNFIKTKIDVTKYGFENDRVERIIDNAIHYAEQQGKHYAKNAGVKLAGSKKLDFARYYINKVDTGVVAKYGEQLENMIERKVAQKFGA